MKEVTALKFKTVWFIIIGIFTIDFITTIIALNVFPTGMFVEANPIAKWFFSFGWIGWVGNYLLMVLITFGLTSFVFWLKKFDKKRKNTNFHPLTLIWVVSIIDGHAIINNITLMVIELI